MAFGVRRFEQARHQSQNIVDHATTTNRILIFRAKGPAIYLAQAEGLGIHAPKMRQGPKARPFLRLIPKCSTRRFHAVEKERMPIDGRLIMSSKRSGRWPYESFYNQHPRPVAWAR